MPSFFSDHKSRPQDRIPKVMKHFLDNYSAAESKGRGAWLTQFDFEVVASKQLNNFRTSRRHKERLKERGIEPASQEPEEEDDEDDDDEGDAEEGDEYQ